MCVLFFDPVHCVGHDVGWLCVCMFYVFSACVRLSLSAWLVV